jgi:CHAT domain-containing protein
MKIRPTFGLIVLAFIPILISSCATKMSLEEAKKATITTTAPTFVPPPRRANDINDLLSKKGIFTSEMTASLIKTADMQPPVGATDATLKEFYERRGTAARHLGRYEQALEDLRTAYGYLQKAGGRRDVIAANLSMVETDMGNFKNAITILEEEILKTSNPWTMYSLLTQFHVMTGDIEFARDMNTRCVEACERFQRNRPREIERIQDCKGQVDRSDGFLLQGEGKFDQAEVSFRKYADYGATLKDKNPRDSINMGTFLIINLIQQGKLLEAEFRTRKALDQSLDMVGKDSVLTGRILTLFVNILRRQGRLPEAEILSRETIAILKASGATPDSLAMSSARIMEGNILFARDDYDGATKVYDRVKVDMQTNRYAFDRYYMRNLNIMVSLIKTGRSAEVLTPITDLYESNRKIYGDNNYATAESLGIRGMAHATLGNNNGAYNDLTLALPMLLKRKLSELANPDRRKRVAMVYESYIALLLKIRGTDFEKQLGIKADAESYKIGTALTGYSLSGALGESSARAAAAYDPDLADLVRREQDTQKEIDVLQETISDLLAVPADEVTAEGIKETRARLTTLTSARATILDEIEKRFPKYADYVNPRLSTVELTQQNLRSGEALVSIYTTNDKTFIWCVPKSGAVEFAVSPLGKKGLTGIVSSLREALDSHPTELGDIPDYDLSLAYDLYSKLLKPAENKLKNTTDILAVVRGPLGQLPLAILPTAPVSPNSDGDLLFDRYREVPWLIRKASLTMLPSVSSLITLRTLPPGDPKRRAFAGFGDPLFSRDQLASSEAEGDRKTTQLASRGGKLQVRGVRRTEKGDADNKEINSMQLADLNRLPDTAVEIKEIASALNADLNRDTFLGKNACKHQVKAENLSDRRVIAFATHALLPGDLDGLDQPALALSSPSVTGDPGDGLLTMGEIMKLRLNADWVVLSACNTGASEGGGAEALTGLGRAFFYAGTRSILASMWPVETTSARKHVSNIFRNQQSDETVTRARALRKSMIGLLDDGTLVDQETNRVIASYAHPLFWAPFVIAGDPGK